MCLELIPPKLLQLFEGPDKRCHGVGIHNHLNNLPFTEWCRLVLQEFVYPDAFELIGMRKKEVSQKVSRNMFRVMRSYEVKTPLPADESFIYSRLDSILTG